MLGGFYTVCWCWGWDDLNTLQCVPEGGASAMRSVELMGKALQEGQWQVLWDRLWLGEQQCEYLVGD